MKQLKFLLRENLIVLFGALVIELIWNFSKNEELFSLNPTSILIFCGVLLLFNFPSFIILLDYYLENRNTKVEMDKTEISISKGTITKNYKFSDIESSIYHLGKYYLNRIDNKHRFKMINSDLAYWELEFNNGDRYYLSNLLVDFLHDKPIVNNTEFRYSMFQTIDRSDSQNMTNLKTERLKIRIEALVKKFEHKTENQLKEIVANPNNYEAEALEAARIVLNKKRLGNNVYN